MGISDNKWKLLINHKDGSTALYNLGNDIGEQHNVAEENPEKFAELFAGIKNMRKILGHGKLKGSEQRPAGWVEHPKPLVEGTKK